MKSVQNIIDIQTRQYIFNILITPQLAVWHQIQHEIEPVTNQVTRWRYWSEWESHSITEIFRSILGKQ